MEWHVYFLTIFSLLGSASCVSNRAFRVLDKKVNLLKTSFQRDVDDLKASFQQEVDDLKFEVLDLKTQLHFEKERTERLEEILNGTGIFPGIDESTPEDDLNDGGEATSPKRLPDGVDKLQKKTPKLEHVQESLRSYERDIQENREDIKTMVALTGKAFQAEKDRARELERNVMLTITNASKATATVVGHLRRSVDNVIDVAQKNAIGLEDMQYELVHTIQKITNISDATENDVETLQRAVDIVTDDAQKNAQDMKDMQRELNHARIEINERITGIADSLQDLQLARAETRATSEDLTQAIKAVTEQGVSTEEPYVETTQQIVTRISRCREAIRAGGKRMAELLYVGVRVKRGEDWKWGVQDGEGPGEVTLVDIDNLDTAWVKVRWDNGHSNSYRMGTEGAYDLQIVEEEFDFSKC